MSVTPPRPEPLPPSPPFLLRMRRALGSALAGFQESAFRSGGVARLPIGLPFGRARRWSYTVRDPELVREVLVTRAPDFPKSVLMDHMLRPLIGSSVFTANGEAWRRRRAIVDQALAEARITKVFDAMLAAADVAVARIEAQAGAVVAMDQEMTRFAADVIFRTLFSRPITEDQCRRIMAAFERFQGVAYAHGILRLYGFPTVLLPGAFRRWRAARAIRRELRPALEARLAGREGGEAAGDILAALMTSADPTTGKPLGESDLLDEMAMFFLAGHETTAAALGWSLYLLAISPQAQDRAHEEALSALGDRAPGFADIRRLTFIRDVFREAMRLYPPVAVLTRDAASPHSMADRDIGQGSLVLVPPWILHRHERHWIDPHAFRPERFETDAGQVAARQAYLPFSLGPRVCPGAAFALQEATVLLALLVRRFRFEPAPGHTPAPVARLTLRSRSGVRLVAHARAVADPEHMAEIESSRRGRRPA